MKMRVIGTNTWDRDIPRKAIEFQSLRFADMVKEHGIAELQDAWISPSKKLLWCSWETENLEALQAAFDEMNAQSGLASVLEIYEDYTPE
jgi:hypothetical protein